MAFRWRWWQATPFTIGGAECYWAAFIGSLRGRTAGRHTYPQQHDHSQHPSFHHHILLSTCDGGRIIQDDLSGRQIGLYHWAAPVNPGRDEVWQIS